MFKYIKPFGYHINAKSIGEAWIDLVSAIIKAHQITFDENRERLCIQNVRLRITSPKLPDEIVERFGNKKNINDIIRLTFNEDKMYDCDIKPSFSPGPKSYYARLKEGKMGEYIVNRLAEIPESKKAVISFIEWDDYQKVLKNPYDDYLPCIVSLQFRLLKKRKGYSMTVIFNSRSIDAFQKSCGNLVAMVMLAEKIKLELQKRLKEDVYFDVLDGMITDAHIYQECYNDANLIVSKYGQYKLLR